jgi:mono/diheme cytochrome c family protein
MGLLPFGFAARARVIASETPRINIVPDMDHQPKYKTQSASPFFADGMSDRLPVDDTVAVGELHDDTEFFQGKNGEAWITSFPKTFAISADKMARGQERFKIYCSPCHGLAGDGDGVVAKRAEELQEGKWVPPTSLYVANVVSQPVGQLFNSITHGVRNMPAYGPQIPAEDRWAILLYVRAMQRSRDTSVADVPAAQLPMLK